MIYLFIGIVLLLAIFAFGESQRQRKLTKKNSHPDFTPLKLDEDRIKDTDHF